MTTPRSSSVLVLGPGPGRGRPLRIGFAVEAFRGCSCRRPRRRASGSQAGGQGGCVHGAFSSVGPPKLAHTRIRNRGWESGTKTSQVKTRQDRERAPCLFRNRYSINLQVHGRYSTEYFVLGTGTGTGYWALGTATVRLGDAFVFLVLSLGT
jgi:hypothetical protein